MWTKNTDFSFEYELLLIYSIIETGLYSDSVVLLWEIFTAWTTLIQVAYIAVMKIIAKCDAFSGICESIQ